MKRFLKEIEQGLKSPVYLLYSGDVYLLREALLDVKRTIPEADRDISFYVFDAEGTEGSIEEMLGALYTVPFFGRRKVVALDNCHRLSEKGLALVGNYVSRPSPDSVLVMLYRTDKTKKRPDMSKSVVSITLDIIESELALWVKDRAKALGFVISDDAADYLIEIVGSEPGSLSPEIEKLSRLAKTGVERGDIGELVKGTGGYNIFDIGDALGDKDPDRVFRIYRALADVIEPQGLLGAINWHYTKRAGKDRESLKQVFEVLNSADIALKSSGSFYPIEYMLLRLLQI